MFFASFLFAIALSDAGKPCIIPIPNEIGVQHNMFWTLTNGMEIGYDSKVDGAAELAQFVSDSLYRPTGIRLSVVARKPALGLYFAEDKSTDEYHLSMTTDLVTIAAMNRELLFNGFQTLLQLLPYQIYYNTTQKGVEWTAQCVVVHDKPRFQWRGLMVDVCRHFFDVDVIKTILDGMSHYKLNVLHFHMTEDQGWRLELKKFPNLTKYGAIRDASPKHGDSSKLDGIPYGPYFFTEDDVREIIRYAAERSIRVIPEIEMPGHALAALSGYPQFSCTGGPFKPRCFWGVEPDIFCAGNDEGIRFLEEILEEVIELFDGAFIHCGGDESPRTRWEKCPKCQQRIKDEGLKNTDQLQCWFTQHFANFLETKGRRLIGWDEILDGGLTFPQSTVVMSWRGTSGGIKAASLGYDVVMSPSTSVYLDYWQFAAPEKYEYLAGYTSAKKIYTYNPTDGIDEKYQHHIIGVQGNLWSEMIWEREDLEWKTFPRALAIAEIAWSKDEDKSWTRFITDYTKKAHFQLQALGVNEAGLQYGTQGIWNKGDLPKDRWVSIEFPVDLCLNHKGHMECAFAYKSGSITHVRNVKMLFSGAVVGEDAHEGIISDEPLNSLYSLNPTVVPGEKISISAELMCEGDDDCEGHLYVYAITFTGEKKDELRGFKVNPN